MLSLSVGIPSYNESKTLRQVIDAVAAQSPLVREIIVIDNGSVDDTAALLADIKAKWSHSNIQLVCSRLFPNKGKGDAVRKAIELAREPYFLVQDADLELSPTEYPELVRPLEHSSGQAVVGNRFAKGYPPHMKRLSILGNWLVTKIANVLFGLHVKDLACGYKILPTAVAKSLALKSDGFEIEPEIIAKLAKKKITIISVPVAYQPRSLAQGKKIQWHHGFAVVLCLLYERFL